MGVFCIMKKYVLFDWDNTLRKGFTITAWMKYLYIRNVIKKKYYYDLLNQFELCNSNRISYEQLSYNTTSIYSSAISGTQFSYLEDLAREFCFKDTFIFPFTYQLFDYFHKNEMEIIIISGSPQVLLIEYSKLLGIDEVYGMIIEVKNDYYTSIIKQDYGIDKQEIVQAICELKGCKPILALGDSSADKPMLSIAESSGIIDKLSGNIIFDGKIVGSVFSANELIENLAGSS